MKSYRTSEADYNRMKAYMDGHYDEGHKRGKLEGWLEFSRSYGSLDF
jgi:hypothetical protein